MKWLSGAILLVFVACAMPHSSWAQPSTASSLTLVQDDDDDGAAKKLVYPKHFWTVQTLAAVVLGAGLTMLIVGYNNFGRMAQLACLNAEGNAVEGCARGKAADVKALEASGFAFVVAGYSAGGAGLLTLAVGGIWLLTSQPKEKASKKQASLPLAPHGPQVRLYRSP